MHTMEPHGRGDDSARENRYLRRAIFAYRVIGTAIVGSMLVIHVANLQPWDDRPWFWFFAMAGWLGWTAGALSALPILGLLHKRPRFALPALLFVISAVLASVSSRIPVSAGTTPTEWSRWLESASLVSFFIAAGLAALVGWGTQPPPRD